MGVRFAVVVAAINAIICCACGGGASLHATTQPGPLLAPGRTAAPPALEELAPPGAIPGVPGGEPDAESIAAPRVVADMTYPIDGVMTWQRSATGALDAGNSLQLTSSPDGYAFGIWRWLGYFSEIEPYELRLQTQAAEGTQFWVLLADYSSGRWQVVGPCGAGDRSLYFDQGKEYFSGAGAVYVGVLAEGGAEVTIDHLTMTPHAGLANTLTATNIRSTSATLSWYFPLMQGPPYPEVYNIYTGPAVDFQLDDPGVQLLGSFYGVYYGSLNATGLTTNTHYFWKVQPGYLVDDDYIWTSLSEETGEFTTLLSNPPVVELYGPYYAQQNVAATLTCYIDDDDTPDSGLTVSWDFENDGTVDLVTQGPGSVDHTYTERGLITATVTVSDGVSSIPASTEFPVGFRFRLETGLDEKKPVCAVAYDREPGTGNVALLTATGQIRTFNGTSWRTISPDWQQGANSHYPDAAYDQDPYLLITWKNGAQTGWTLRQYDTGWDALWESVDSATSLSDTYYDAHMDLASNDLYSIVFAGSIATAPGYTGNLDIWHMKSDGTWITDSVALDTDKFQACEVVRNATESYFAYCKDTGLHIWRFNDGGNTDTLEQSYSGDASEMVLEMDPANPGHVFWATLNGGRIYYGDNYGAANGAAQYITPPLAPTDLVAVGLAGDNQGLVFWTDEDADQIQHLYGCNTMLGGVPFEIAAGTGVAADGVGAFYGGTSGDGVDIVVNEERDGECARRLIENSTTLSTEQVAAPARSDRLPAAAAVARAGGGFWSLASQEYPSTLSMYAAGTELPFTNTVLGEDSWCGLDCAAAAPDGGIYIGSYLNNGDLLLSHLDPGDIAATPLVALAGTSSPRLAANRARTELRLFYLADGNTRIEERDWNGSDWSALTVVVSGASVISTYNVSPFADDSGWGIAYIDAVPALRLCEKAGGVWSAPEFLAGGAINPDGGIGMDYKTAAPAGSLLVALTTTDTQDWVLAGVRPPGGEFSWRQFSTDTPASNGFETTGAFWQNDNPIVIACRRYQSVYVIEHVDAEGFAYDSLIQLYGDPVGMAMLDSGEIVLGGVMQYASYRTAETVILYP